jgi:hypothetical protein
MATKERLDVDDIDPDEIEELKNGYAYTYYYQGYKII